MATALVETFGPFLIPVALFVFGLGVYWLLLFFQEGGTIFR